MTEKGFQASVIKLAKLCGWSCYHTHDSRRSQAGFPDLVLAHPKGGLLFAELKTEQGKVSAAQEEWKEVLTQAGSEHHIWRPSDWDRLYERLTRHRRRAKKTKEGDS